MSFLKKHLPLIKFNGCYITLLSISFAAISSCQTYPAKETYNFGIYDNYTLKMSDLNVQEKSALIAAQKQLYETAERILENHYLNTWFTNYQVKNKFPSLKEAKKDYFAKNISVSEIEVNKFLKENVANKELMQIPESQKIPTVRQYLMKVAQAHAEQLILGEAYKQGKIKLTAFTKPQPQIVQFDEGGHIYDQTIKNPTITLVEFADYQCPFCVKANPEIMKVVDAYKGKIQFIFRDFPLLDKHSQALPSALAAKCSEIQGKYWEMHTLIFDRAPMEELTSTKYTNFAEKLKLNLTQFTECQNDPVQKESIVADLNEGLSIGVNETPTLYINGEKFDDYITYENLKNAIDERLKNELK